MVSSRRPVGLDVNAWMYVSLLLFVGSVRICELVFVFCHFYLCIVLDQVMVSIRRPLVLLYLTPIEEQPNVAFYQFLFLGFYS